jgi:hypothetical protein
LTIFGAAAVAAGAVAIANPTVASGSPSAGTGVSRAAATPYDGLMFNIVGIASPETPLRGFVAGCQGVALISAGSGGGGVGATFRASHDGITVPAPGGGAQVWVVNDPERRPVGINGSALVAAPAGGRVRLSFSATRDHSGCAPLAAMGDSKAGSVYAINWNVTDAQGTGCVALTYVEKKLIAAVVELSGCSSASFPTPPKPMAIGGASDLELGIFDGAVIKLSGDEALRTMRAQGGVCGNAPKLKYMGDTTRVQVVRGARGTALSVPEYGFRSIFGMDVNTRNQAYTWGGFVALIVRGAARNITINQTDPAKSLHCPTRPKPQLMTSSLPAGVWVGRKYLGRSWMQLSRSGGAGWTLTVAFGSSPR